MKPKPKTLSASVQRYVDGSFSSNQSAGDRIKTHKVAREQKMVTVNKILDKPVRKN